MGFEHTAGQQHSDTFLRNLALSAAASYGNTTIIKQAKKMFADRTTKQIPADVRSVVYAIVASYGTDKEWKVFMKLYSTETLHEEKDRYARALTSFRDKTLLAKTLMFALSKDVRTQDAPFIIGQVWQNSQGRDLTWKFVQHNWQTILSRYGEGGHFLSRLLSPLGSHTKTKDATDAKKFFATHAAPGADRTLEQSYERIYSNAAWLKADKASIKKWLGKTVR
jgi:aminopeptidase N